MLGRMGRVLRLILVMFGETGEKEWTTDLMRSKARLGRYSGSGSTLSPRDEACLDREESLVIMEALEGVGLGEENEERMTT